MASEANDNLPPEGEELEEEDAIAKESEQRTNKPAVGDDAADDDRGDDQLVIDEPEEKSDGESDENKEFEPTIDMMMNDFDDERTMEEEEAEDDQDNEEDELAALEQEQDMPIEELLKMYNYGPPQPSVQESSDDKHPLGPSSSKGTPEKKGDQSDKDHGDGEEGPSRAHEHEKDDSLIDMSIHDEDDGDGDLSGGKRRGSSSPQPPSKKSRSELARFYEAAVEGRALRSQVGGQPDDIDEEEDEDADDSDFEGRDYSWKKTIMIGPSYQASVPSGMASYGDTLPYENEDKHLWNPGQLTLNDVEDYLIKSQETVVQSGGVGSLPLGAHVRDDEQALFILLQCGYNCEEALRRRRMNAVPTADTMSLWSEEECRAFELGLRLYGKDFHMIQSQKVRTRSVGELVQFYYLWKKTERHDVFANNTRLEKKKYTLHPGTTDYMDRFIDEQDPPRDRSSSPNFYSLMFGGSEGRKGLTLHPGAKSQLSHGDSNGGAVDTNLPTSAAPTSSPTAAGAVTHMVSSSLPNAASNNGKAAQTNSTEVATSVARDFQPTTASVQ